MDINFITAALVEAINAPTRPPALWPLAFIKYPGRELQPQANPDGTATATVSEIVAEKNIVKLETVCTNQKGEVVVKGMTTVMPPKA